MLREASATGRESCIQLNTDELGHVDRNHLTAGSRL